MTSLRTEKAIGKVIEAVKAGADVAIDHKFSKRGNCSLTFYHASDSKKIATFTLQSLVAKRGPKRKRK